MFKELKILAVVVSFSLLTYYLVEPFAHGEMHAHVESNHFQYDGSADIEEVEVKIENLKAEKETKEKAEEKVAIEASIVTETAHLEAKKTFWSDVKRISAIKGDAAAGETAYAACAGCHFKDAPAMGGVRPPELNVAGALYAKDYLIGLIKDPTMASNVDHKFSAERQHPMSSVVYMVSSDEDIANVVAYLQSIAPSIDEVTPKIAFENACGRCHANKYMKWTQIGTKPTFKYKKDDLAFQIKTIEYQDGVKAYMGKLPPDLSMYYRSRGEHFLETFIENPQSHLAGTAMPRVGVTAEGAEKVIEYLIESADPKHAERNETGKWVMIYMIFFVLAAYLWKRQIWKDLH